MTIPKVFRGIAGELRHPIRMSDVRTAAADRPWWARALYGLSLPIVLGWLVVVGALNIAVPQLETVIDQHAKSFLPDEASAVQALVKMGDHFGGGGSNNFVYLLVEGQQPLDGPARDYYDAVVHRLTADERHVSSIMNLWSDPDLAPAAQSADGRAAYGLVNLTGNMGTAAAMESTRVARDIIAAVPAPEGVSAHITGPSAVVNDELVAISDSILRLIILCSVLVTAVLLAVYRSPVTALVPLVTVAASLGGARALIALFSQMEWISVSIFAAALSAVVVLGAGTNYGIFLVGRYQEGRRRGLDSEAAFYAALSGVAHIIIASALTVAGAMACLTLTRLSIFSTSGLPCTIAIIVTLCAALTLGPSLLAILIRMGYVEPRGDGSARRWRRIATAVVRWPGPVLTGATAILLVAIAFVPMYQPSYDERRAQPTDSPANMGFAAADRHLPPNVMAPSVVIIEADHDMRNPADLIALERLTAAIAGLDGIDAVQGMTRPLKAPIAQGTLASQAGYIGSRIEQSAALLNARLGDIEAVESALDGLDGSARALSSALSRGQSGAVDVVSAMTVLKSEAVNLTSKLAIVQDASQPAVDVLRGLPQCQSIEVCQGALTGFSLIDDVRGLDELSAKVEQGTAAAAAALPDAASQIPAITTAIAQVRQVIQPLKSSLQALIPQTTEITAFLDEVSRSYAEGAPSTGFFLPAQAIDSPLFRSAVPYFFSSDGTVTRMVVTPEIEGFSRQAMDLSERVIPAALGAIKGTSLQGATVSIGGPGGTLLNIESFAHEDFIAIAVAAFAFVFCVVLVLLRSLVAAVVVITTVGISYLAALGLGVFVWQTLVGNPLHWAVAPVAFSFLVAVGADYNMLLVSRMKEEMAAGTSTGLIRAMVGTGSVVTTAGLTFGATMFAMLGSSATNIAQIGTTVAFGLVIDTLIVRSLMVPAIARLCGRWFWWPAVFVRMPTHAGSASPTLDPTKHLREERLHT